MDDTNDAKDAQRHTGFRRIEGGLHRTETMNGVEVVLGPEHQPPFEIEAKVEEEDTCLVLSTPADIVVTLEHPIRVMTEVRAAEPLVPGSVIAREGAPLRLLAIVHDLDQEPSWKEAWVKEALDGALEEVEARGLRTIGLPMIGSVHGSLSPERFMLLLRDVLQRFAPRTLERIWLISKP